MLRRASRGAKVRLIVHPPREVASPMARAIVCRRDEKTAHPLAEASPAARGLVPAIKGDFALVPAALAGPTTE